MTETLAVSGTHLLLGRRGEHLARRVVFDISGWLSAYGDGTVRLLHQRSNDAAPCPVEITRDGARITWDVTRTDTDQPGRNGLAELRYYAGETLVKSELWHTIVLPALSAPLEEAPAAGQSWIDSLLDAAARVEDVSGRVRQAVDEALEGALTEALLAELNLKPLSNSELESLLV